MKANTIAIAAVFSLLLVSFLLAGCTSNKYLPCCIKGEIYDSLGVPKTPARCYFQNGTLFGQCYEFMEGAASCADTLGTTCESLDEEDCLKTANCAWDTNSPVACSGGQARWMMAVCTDRVPDSCINNKCTAMMCGYTAIRPSPPPASQDWNASKAQDEFAAGADSTAMSASELILPTINLQGATCDFNTMNKKLYNKVKSSRGALWVNSFRFGIGSSFGDFEQSRNFFPATDRVCAANPYAQVDRFTVYLNMEGTYCKEKSSFYICSGPRFNGMTFADEFTCKLYCGGGEGAYHCNANTNAGEKRFICNQDGFAYGDEETCNLKCSIIDNPNACTNDETKFPFLNTDDTDEARYRTKLVSDYMVDAYNYIGSSATCSYYGQPEGTKSFPHWRIGDEGNAWACNDYRGSPGTTWYDGPWFDTYNCKVANGGTCPGGTDYLGELRTYFDNHAYTSLDFDYNYYKKMLIEQYANGNMAAARLPYECESSIDCISGNCDTTYYKRPMCVDTDDQTLFCLCSKQTFNDNTPYPSCQYQPGDDASLLPIYADTNIHVEKAQGRAAAELYNYGALFAAEHSFHAADGTATTDFTYYVPAPLPNSPKPAPFSICEVEPVERKAKCIDYDIYAKWIGTGEPGSGDGYYEAITASRKTIWSPGAGGLCHYKAEGFVEPPAPELNPFLPKNYWVYDFELNNEGGAIINPEKFGKCALNGEIGTKPATPPYLKMKDLGWCAGCTYSTLAVQKVEWGTGENPGGVGIPRQYSCYEYRGEFNYVPGKYPYGGAVNEEDATFYSGQIRWDQGMATPSTEPVRKKSNPSSYQYDQDGNIKQGSDQPCDDDMCYTYFCEDEWHGTGGWWQRDAIPTPSAPYLKEKLTSYLQSNVMPILDEVDAKTTAAASAGCSNFVSPVPYQCSDPNEYYSTSLACVAACAGTCTGLGEGMEAWTCPVDGKLYPNFRYGDDPDVAYAACNAGCFARANSENYPPLSICRDMGGDGAVLHVIGNTSMLVPNGGGNANYGKIVLASVNEELKTYMGYSSLPNSVTVSFTTSMPGMGKNAILARTYLLKNKCKTPPLVGIEILPGETLDELVGTGDLLDQTNNKRGTLHQFFYGPLSPPSPTYVQKVARGNPDKYPDEVDVLLQDWYPVCGYSRPNMLSGEREIYEIERRLDYSRALLGNFSKPSLIWKFAFPDYTACDTTFFLDYLFNNTAAMVDAGIIGIVYSDWATQEGLPYGPDSRYYSDTHNYDGRQHSWSGYIDTGLSTDFTTKRADLNTRTLALDDIVEGGKTDLFCEMQRFSKRAIGYIKYTYGQKIYAADQVCECETCSDYDYMTGACDLAAKTAQSSDPNLAQLYCNDATKCTMPSPGQNDFYKYRCAYRCMNYNACILCSAAVHLGDASFCRITPTDGDTMGVALPYGKISDDYWEFLAGLSPEEKCCLKSTAEGVDAKYTYVSMEGTKQQAEFLQFPRRGEYDIDCGRAPDTSVLTYCNIRVPISQKEIACMKIDDPGAGFTLIQATYGD